jgi:RNA recognition motif. (a.k.a. RRM, RBD, or RNP domain)
VRISNLPHNTHWTELKDAMRKVGEVIYANVEGDEG